MITHKVSQLAAILAGSVLLTTLAACDLVTEATGRADAEVQVVDPNGTPIQGAVVTGGYDWESYRRTTDAQGRARVPARQIGHAAEILAVNHFPRMVELRSTTYTLDPTPARLESLGKIAGQPLRVSADEVLTFDRYGTWRRYEIRDGEAREETALTLRPASELAGHVQLFGDDLWLLRTDGTIEVWSVADSSAPAQRLVLPNVGMWLAKHDSLLVVRNDTEKRTDLWYVGDEGQARRLSSIPLHVPAAAFVGDALYLLPMGDILGTRELTVVDTQDPERPEVVQVAAYPEFGRVTILGDRAILTTPSADPEAPARHRILDLSDPFHPRDAGELSGNGYVTQQLTAEMSIGFTPDPHVAALVETVGGEVRVLATTTAQVARVWPHPDGVPVGAAHDRLVAFAGHLWRLVD
jgi:hypothetical protein